MEIKLEVPYWAGGEKGWYEGRQSVYPNWQEGAYYVAGMSDCDGAYEWDDHEVWYCPKAFPKGVLYYHGSGCSCNSAHDDGEDENSFTQCESYEEFLTTFLNTRSEYGSASEDETLSFKGTVRRFFRELERDEIRCM